MENKTELKDFTEQIKKGFIEVIDLNKLIIEDYPYGFKKCKMVFNKVRNRLYWLLCPVRVHIKNCSRFFIVKIHINSLSLL